MTARAHRLPDAFKTFESFLAHVKTKDRDGKIKPIPLYPFIRRVAAEIDTYRLLAYLKSRQMFMTWIVAAYAVYSLLKFAGTEFLIASKGEREANEAKDRAMIVYWNLPEWMRLPVTRDITGLTVWENGSKLMSLPASPGIGRTFTSGTVVLDEAAHLEHGREMWNGLAPTLDATGKGIMLTTPGLRDKFFRQVWKQEPTGWFKSKVYWREHPLRDDAWAAAVKATLVDTGENWDAEYELNIDAYTGLVFPEYDVDSRAPNTAEPHEIPTWWTRIVGVDHGLQGFAAEWLAHDPHGRRVFYQEHLAANVALPDNIERIKALSAGQTIAAWPTDPTVTGRDIMRLSSFAQEFTNRGVPISLANRNVDISLNRMKAALVHEIEGAKMLRVMRTCPALIRGLRDLTWEQVQRRDKPHAVDAARYAWMYDLAPHSVQPLEEREIPLLPLPAHSDPTLDPMSRSVYFEIWRAEQEAEGVGGGLW